MKISLFRVQLAVVVALVILVGWPRFRPLPEVRVWANRGTAPQPDLLTRDARLRDAGDEDQARRRGSGVVRRRTTANAAAGNEADRNQQGLRQRTTGDDPQDLDSAGARFNGIVGRARTLTNIPVPYGRMVLRNTRTGLIEARTTADQEGRFSFLDVSQSGYVIELVGADGSVIASSELVSVQNGDVRQATVRVAANSTVRAIFGSTAVAPTVQEAVNRAVQNSVREVSDSVPTISPN